MDDAVVIDPAIQHGRPVIRGTRMPVTRVLGGLAGGMSIAEVCDAYGLSDAEVRGALAYAERIIEQKVFYPLQSPS